MKSMELRAGYCKELDMLTRYEMKYLFCRKSQAVSVLKQAGFPVELFFYCALETTRDIHAYVFGQGGDRWGYAVRMMGPDDMKLLGVTEHIARYASYPDAEERIIETLEAGLYPLVWGNKRYLPWHGQLIDAPHSIIVTGFRTDHHGSVFTVIDSGPDMIAYEPFQCERGVMADFCLNALKAKSVVCYEVDTKKIDDETRLLIRTKFHTWLDGHEDDCAWYDAVPSLVPDKLEDTGLKRLDDALSIVSGSRSLFYQYLRYSRYPEELCGMAAEIAKLSEMVKNLILRYKITGSIKMASVEKHCAHMKLLEKELIRRLKLGEGQISRLECEGGVNDE
jgi:hypothetical protein